MKPLPKACPRCHSLHCLIEDSSGVAGCLLCGWSSDVPASVLLSELSPRSKARLDGCHHTPNAVALHQVELDYVGVVRQ